MKTLFLMSIAGILLVIAVKQPNQTAQEAVWELYGKVKTMVMETTAPSSGPDFAETETALPPGVAIEPNLPTWNPQTGSFVQPASNTPADEPAQATEVPEEPHITEKTPEIAWETPPALPTLSVEHETIVPPTVPASGPENVTEPSANHAYEEVNVHYQNAKRLLEEMSE